MTDRECPKCGGTMTVGEERMTCRDCKYTEPLPERVMDEAAERGLTRRLFEGD